MSNGECVSTRLLVITCKLLNWSLSAIQMHINPEFLIFCNVVD